MTTPRPPFQFTLDLPIPGRGEAPRPAVREVEVVTAVFEPESPAPTANLMKAICDPDNIEAALRAVVRNKGAARRRRDHRSPTTRHPQSALAGDRTSPVPGALPAATGASGANPKAG